MPPPTAAYNDDVAVNEVALQAAGAQSAARSLLRSFLGGTGNQGAQENADPYSPDDQDEFEVPRDLDGVGYAPPAKDNLANLQSREASAATELLRKQLLGKRSTKQSKTTTSGRAESRNNPMAQPPRRQFRKLNRHDGSDDDEDGRLKMGKTTMPKVASSEKTGYEGSQKVTTTQDSTINDAAPSKKRGSSYLDQVLAERAARKTKRKKPLED